MPGIPERWGAYTALGNIVGNTKFIPFKVPLKPTLCKNLPEVERFTPSELLSKIEKLGLVIDLTNTKRYYDPEELTAKGVSYVKIFCQGHGHIPDNSTIRKFCDAVHHFLNENKDGLIGVHCTHGLNRTGYLICRYMIENLKYSAEDAIKEFNKARGHDIERLEYLRDLYKIESKYLNAASSESSKTVSEKKTYQSFSTKYRNKYCQRNSNCDAKPNSRGFCERSNHYDDMHFHRNSRYYQGENNSWRHYGRHYEHDSYRETRKFPNATDM